MSEILEGPDVKTMEEIRKELGEDPERFANNLAIFEKWVDCQEHLPRNYDRRILPIFLRGCKHDMELAKKKFPLFYAVREAMGAMFAPETEEEELLSVTRVATIAALPRLTPDGCRVMLFRLSDPDPARFDMNACLRFVARLYDLRLHEERPIGGEVHVFDGANFGAAHCAKFVSVTLKRVLAARRLAYPLRIRRIHVVNAPPFLEKILSLVRPYMHRKVRERFLVHKRPEELFRYVPAEVLPVEMGGTGGRGEELMGRWYRCMREREAWFERMRAVKCEGPIPKSVSQTCGVEEGMGVEGSFRKLEID